MRSSRFVRKLLLLAVLLVGWAGGTGCAEKPPVTDGGGRSNSLTVDPSDDVPGVVLVDGGLPTGEGEIEPEVHPCRQCRFVVYQGKPEPGEVSGDWALDAWCPNGDGGPKVKTEYDLKNARVVVTAGGQLGTFKLQPEETTHKGGSSFRMLLPGGAKPSEWTTATIVADDQRGRACRSPLKK